MSGIDEGKQGIGAFFDVDGTLIPGPSLERRFFRVARHCGAIHLANYLLWAREALRLLPQGITAVVHGNKRYWSGVRCDQVLGHIAPIIFFEEGMERVAWHARQGHRITLVSGIPELLAEMAARAMECELEARGASSEVFVCATRMEEQGGKWTGRLLRDAMYGEEKSRAVKRIARELGMDLRRSHAYGNTLLDWPMLAAVGQAHAVNPDTDLAVVANQFNWEICHWQVKKTTAEELPLAGSMMRGGESRA